MAAKKKPAAKTTAEPQNKIPEETAKTIMDPNASTAEKLNALQNLADNLPEPESGEEAPASDGQNPESEKEPMEQENHEAPEPESEKEPEPITSDTPCPFEATVSVALPAHTTAVPTVFGNMTITQGFPSIAGLLY